MPIELLDRTVELLRGVAQRFGRDDLLPAIDAVAEKADPARYRSIAHALRGLPDREAGLLADMLDKLAVEAVAVTVQPASPVPPKPPPQPQHRAVSFPAALFKTAAPPMLPSTGITGLPQTVTIKTAAASPIASRGAGVRKGNDPMNNTRRGRR